MVFQLRTLADAHEFRLRHSNVGLMNRLEGSYVFDERKKARPDAGTSGQAVREDALQGNASRIQFNTADGGGQGSIAIADYLSHGQANAIPLRDLERMTGLDGRTIRAMIAAILSDNLTGYYLPANEEEKARFVRSMRHRAKEILCAADAVERS